MAVRNQYSVFIMAILKSCSKFFSRKSKVSSSVSSLQPKESHRRRHFSWIYKIFTSMHCTASLDAQLAAEEAAAATATATVCSSTCSKDFVVSAALPEMMAVSFWRESDTAIISGKAAETTESLEHVLEHTVAVAAASSAAS